MPTLDIDYWNKKLRYKTPVEIADWALRLSDNYIVTTSFGVYSSVLLSTMSVLDHQIRVVWCDTLYNGESTYEYAASLTEKYKLNIHKYQPLFTKTEIERTLGSPDLEDDNHSQFSEIVKLEPFKRALSELNPDVWFTNIRVRQTAYRDKKDILSYSKDGILKVSPFYYWTDEDLDQYVLKYGLKKNLDYFDPVKALSNRECGIHFR
ncbi:MAG: phosphoadenosine phosphosulfate reductase family protein [Winogradskyella sp.]|uniref:phosphoadenosine phosphosulfate reductase domain-containing protein n=1 Tax=Winogradskyella sp. TaxID=1883156 RepID=UPI0025E57938|nr:phosphoadenosine phosphosulfate reductase family protein [Winogradskyella sp.]NRB83623.1 phosphoadenosine phosphosulfate reductase family protein [Winogradskyella sp.]